MALIDWSSFGIDLYTKGKKLQQPAPPPSATSIIPKPGQNRSPQAALFPPSSSAPAKLPSNISTVPEPPGFNLSEERYPTVDPYAEMKAAQDAEQARQNQLGKDQSDAQNKATAEAVDAKHGLLKNFEKQRDIKLANIAEGYEASDANLLLGYRDALRGLEGTRDDNDKSQADSSYANIVNTLRERSDILSEVASQGAGETDRLRAQLAALRNYDANQSEVDRSYFDTVRSINRAVGGLNIDTATSRKNLFDQRESDRESAWSNFYNQTADAWNEIFNIENANTNIDSDSSNAYKKKYKDAAKKVQEAVGSSYSKETPSDSLRVWDDQGQERTRRLSSNRAQVINLGGAMQRPEGATLRRW